MRVHSELSLLGMFLLLVLLIVSFTFSGLVVSDSSSETHCSERLRLALQNVLQYIDEPNGLSFITPIYEPPEVRLRKQADQIEQKRRDLTEARKMLKECSTP